MEQNMNSNESGLSRAAGEAVALLAGLGGAQRRAALEALGAIEARRVWTSKTPGDLPTLTALAVERDREAVYASTAWASVYRRGQTTVVYVLQAPGLGALSRRLGGVSVAKVGTAAAENLARRVAELGRCEYGRLDAWRAALRARDGLRRLRPRAAAAAGAAASGEPRSGCACTGSRSTCRRG